MTTRPCWSDEGARYALPFDAGSVDDALFQAVHVPALITRLRFRGGTGEGDTVVERDVLEDLLRGEASMRVAAVVGEVGTGKSHLVRWLHAELQRRRVGDSTLGRRLHVVYIPKRKTTLRGVVERILEGQTGPKHDDFTKRLQEAEDKFNPDTARYRLRDNLANAIRDLKADEFNRGDKHRWLMIDRLPELIQDPVFSQRLLTPDGVLVRTLEHALERSGVAQDGRPRLSVADLQLDLADLSDMAGGAQRTFRQLVGNQALQDAALVLLNEQLDGAVGRLFNIGRGQIGDLLQDVRAELARQDRELVLLIEDFSLLQGVERELLEAIITPVTEPGSDRRLCPIRAAFAVTPGHFDDMQTVVSRFDADGGFQYSLDVPFGDSKSPASIDHVARFVGSYLNACRLGKDNIERWHREVAVDAPEEPVANRCATCELRADCHASFGRSDGGHGLYPFNKTALARILRGQGWTHFEARDLLTHIRDTVSDEFPAHANGTFPTERWASRHNPTLTPTSLRLREELKSHYGDDAPRAERVLMFWAGKTDELVNLPADIHEAFHLARPDGVPTVPLESDAPPEGEEPPEPAPEPPAPEPPPEKPEPTPFDRDLRALEAWRSAVEHHETHLSEMPGPLARELREQVAGLVLQRSTSTLDTLSHVPEDAKALSTGIVIEGAASGNPPTEKSTVLRFGVDHEKLFIALRKRHRKMPLLRSELLTICDEIDARVEMVQTWLRDRVQRPEALRDALQVLGLAALGTLRPDLHRGDYGADHVLLPRIFAVAQFAGSNPESPGPFQELARELAQPCQLQDLTATVLRAAAVRQTPDARLSGSSGVDAAKLLPMLDLLVQSDLGLTFESSRSGIGQVLSRAERSIDPAIAAGLDRVRAVSELVRDAIGDERDGRRIADSINASLASITSAVGALPDVGQLRILIDELGRIDFKAHLPVWDHSLRAASRTEQLEALGAINWEILSLADNAVRALATALDQADERLTEMQGGPGIDPATQRQLALKSVEALSDSLSGLGGHLERKGEPVAR